MLSFCLVIVNNEPQNFCLIDEKTLNIVASGRLRSRAYNYRLYNSFSDVFEIEELVGLLKGHEIRVYTDHMMRFMKYYGLETPTFTKLSLNNNSITNYRCVNKPFHTFINCSVCICFAYVHMLMNKVQQDDLTHYDYHLTKIEIIKNYMAAMKRVEDHYAAQVEAMRQNVARAGSDAVRQVVERADEEVVVARRDLNPPQYQHHRSILINPDQISVSIDEASSPLSENWADSYLPDTPSQYIEFVESDDEISEAIQHEIEQEVAATAAVSATNTSQHNQITSTQFL